MRESVDDNEVGACWECCARHVGRTKQAKNLGRKHLEQLSERGVEGIYSEKATREAGGEEGVPPARNPL